MASATLSSASPGGHDLRCPVCGTSFRTEFSAPLSAATCPACNASLCCYGLGAQVRCVERGKLSEAEWQEIQDRLDLRNEPDSLDLAEALMEFEERYGDRLEP
ncbi:MAG: hypothetical protein KIS92_08525 [Planctomycetota bacterium]|nr:hypothetical protein [Planctomycetota bacterium]